MGCIRCWVLSLEVVPSGFRKREKEGKKRDSKIQSPSDQFAAEGCW